MLSTRPHRGVVAFLIVIACGAAGCRAQPNPDRQAGQLIPAQARTLRSFGAAGDGRTDDTAAMVRAFEGSSGYCLEGEGRSYRVVGTLRAANDLCLRNATLIQSQPLMDTRKYIKRLCPRTQDPAAVIDCRDPAMTAGEMNRLWRSLSVRTLLVRPGGDRPVRLYLERVKVDRGPHAELGSRSDSAGIWVDGAARVDLRSVEITGGGKGYGLQITNSRNITLSDLWVHDLVWAPYPGDALLSQSHVAEIGWNSVPIHEFREQGRGPASTGGAGKFYGVRVQEQLSCVSLSSVSHVRIRRLKIERCLAQFDTGKLPWQADGLDIGRSSSDIVIDGATIDSTWEGVDVAAGGAGVAGLQINDLTVSNSFSFGLKMGYQLRNARVSGVNVDGAGLSGIVIYGPARDVRISGAAIRNVGAVRGPRGRFSPWPAGNRAGIRIDGAPGSAPEGVLLEATSVSGRPQEYEFGILNTGGKRVEVRGLQAEGFSAERAHGIAGDP